MDARQPELRNELVTLRLVQRKDIPAVMAAANDPATQRWTPLPEFDAERAESHVRNAPSYWADGKGARWAVADTESDDCVGLLDLSFVPGDPGACEVFFMSAPASRGKGYMTAALRLAAHWALTEHGAERVEWQALVGNVASQRVAQKAGFQHEGILRKRSPQRGERYDSWVASLTRADLPNSV